MDLREPGYGGLRAVKCKPTHEGRYAVARAHGKGYMACGGKLLEASRRLHGSTVVAMSRDRSGYA